jgi:hypothetical protein
MPVISARTSTVFNLTDPVQSIGQTIGPAVTEQHGDRILGNKNGIMIHFAKDYM